LFTDADGHRFQVLITDQDGEVTMLELRHRLWHTAARVVRHARRLVLRLQATWPWSAAIARAFARLRALPLRC
jgi:hypothetical protein